MSPNAPGIVSMARGDDPASATDVVLHLHRRVPRLNGKYTAFARVVRGMDVVQAIGGRRGRRDAEREDDADEGRVPRDYAVAPATSPRRPMKRRGNDHQKNQHGNAKASRSAAQREYVGRRADRPLRYLGRVEQHELLTDLPALQDCAPSPSSRCISRFL